MLTTYIMYASAYAAQLPQNPSPMRDTTRDHSRVEERQVPGRRLTVSLGTLMLPPQGRPSMLLIHFHSSPWLVEYCARKRFPSAAVLTVNLGAGSDVYREPFVDVTRFSKLIDEAAKAAGGPFRSVVLSSFSAGYGAVREILRDKYGFEVVLCEGYGLKQINTTLAKLQVRPMFLSAPAASVIWSGGRIPVSESWP